MGRRRAARELALRVLFQVDVGGMSAEEAFALAAGSERCAAETVEFARQLVAGVLAHRDEIDRTIEEYARGWTLSRMANVDRNVLRLAVFELTHMPDIPASVTLDEAVEMAKKYSTAESGRFVNGILGSLARELEERAREAPAP